MPDYGDSTVLYRNYNSNDNTILSVLPNGSLVPTIESTNCPAQEGYRFKEWNTSHNGNGTTYSPGDVAPVNGYLYAIWEEIPYDVTISYKGSTIATMSSSGTKTLNTSGTYCEDDITIDYTKTGITVVETLDPNGGTIVSISGDPVTSLQAKTVTPTSQSQTISADSGYDAISEVLVQGDSNLIGSNIASGVSIFGVVGTFAGGGGGDDLKNFIEQHGTITSFTDSTISTIGQGAFACCYSLTYVSLPSCTGSIEAYAFYKCLNLTTVNFSACTSIGSYAFASCSNLTTASFSACTSIESYAFASCSKLATISFPSCTSIGNYAFYCCSNLTTASFPVCTSIGSYAFSSCSSLTTANFSACTSIGSYAFANCLKLMTASFSACTSIDGYAFNGCRSLTTISFPSCKYIGSYAFSYCYNLTTASFPSCSIIFSSAFRDCSCLTSISFPVCERIASNAFGNCSSLTLISFPSCTYIQASAFLRCYNLVSLYFMGSSVVSLGNSNAFTSTPIAGYTASTGGVYGSIFVPSSLYNTYITSTNWVYFSSRFVSV